jgi:hypothetical protein
MKPITILLVALFILVTTTVQAATLDSKESARKLTDQVMAKLTSGDFNGGLLLTKPYLIIPESEFNVMLEKLKLQLPAIQTRFGKTIASEFISEKMIGKSLLQIIQIQKFERHIMRWRFIFYNPAGKWILNTFNFDDNIQSLFEE